MNENAFLGQGWKFPIEVDTLTGKIKTSSYEENIADSIRIIIGTSKGERVMNKNFGCDIKKFMFESFDYTVSSEMSRCVIEALQEWEPRITDIKVDVSQSSEDSSRININISYVVRSTNNPYNLVYPFYMNEGI